MKEKIIIAIIIAISILGYGYMNQKTKLQVEENRRVEKETIEENKKLEKEFKEIKLEQCFLEANNNYNLTWDNSCRSKYLENSCRLPTYEVDIYNSTLKNDKDNCIKIYK